MKKLLSALLAASTLFACTERGGETPVAVTIEFESSSISLEVGQRHTLVYTIVPEDKVPVFESSDISVATVEDGVVTAVANGTATIKATVEGSDATDECVVTVSDISAKSVTLNETGLDMLIGDEFRLEAVVEPENAANKTITWTSTDETVASVSADGLVKALAEGEATVIASVYGSDAKAECAVKVSPILAQTVRLNESDLDLAVGGTFQLEATVEPDNTTDKTVTWTSSDENVASVTAEGLVTAVAAGNATITAACGTAEAKCEVSVGAAGYKVGDLYDVNGVKGVVFEVESDGVHGKIVSLDESGAVLWAASGYGSYNTGAKSETDGKANTDKLVEIGVEHFPAAEWCVNHGEGWYMPAINEGQAWLAIRDELNPTITANGGTAITDYYWSSTEGEEDSTQAIYFYVSSFGENGVSSYGDWKDNPEGDTYVRAIYAF